MRVLETHLEEVVSFRVQWTCIVARHKLDKYGVLRSSSSMSSMSMTDRRKQEQIDRF